MKLLRISFLAFFAVATQFAVAQKGLSIDSLQAIISTTTSPEDLRSTLIEFARENYKIDFDKANGAFTKAYELSIQSGDTASILRAGWSQGEIWRKKGMEIDSRKRLDFVLALARKTNNRKYITRSLNSLGIIFSTQGYYDSALNLTLQSLKIREEDKDVKGMSISNNNIGLLFYKIGNYEMALNYYFKSLKEKKSINDTYDMDLLMSNISLCLIELDKLDAASEMLKENIDYSKKLGSNSEAKATMYLSLGKFSEAKNEFKSALTNFETGLSFTNDPIKQIQLRYLEAEMNIRLGNLDKAAWSMNRCNELLKTNDSPVERMHYYDVMAILSKSNSDLASMANYQKKYIGVHDSLFNTNFHQNVSIYTEEVDAKNKTKYKESQITSSSNYQIEMLTLIVIIAFLSFVCIYMLIANWNIYRNFYFALVKARA